MSEGHSLKVVFTSLAGNAVIAASKVVAAVLTGSGSMLAEAIHSGADCLNQILLVVGVRQSASGPSQKFPLGTGRASYFWSFIVALMLFFGGGVFSIGEGVEKIIKPEAIEAVGVGVGTLVFAFAIEAYSLWSCIKGIDEKRGKFSRWDYLQVTKDAELVVCTGENSAAVAGLLFALIALLLAKWVHPVFDGIGSIMVGLVLVGVASFLARKVKSLLLGEAADPDIEEKVRLSASEDARIIEVLRIITIQQGPGEVMIAAKLRFADDAPAKDVVEAINNFEGRVRDRLPDVKWQFIEPDSAA